MLTSDSGSGATERRQPRIGLALAGGGPEGAVYEIGALRALEESLEGVDFSDLHIYVGVSGGAFLASCLANSLSTEQLCEAILSPGDAQHPFTPETFFTPAFREILHRGAMIPRLLGESLWSYLAFPRDLTLREAFLRMSRALPVGVFDNEPIRRYLEKIFSAQGRTNDFRELGKRLVVVAADLDSGEAVRFGEPGLDHVPISKAVQASTALPALYPPVVIDGRYYVDGVLLKTLHASVALEAGADLLFCINPIVPVDTARAVDAGVMKRGRLVDRGLPTVLSQTFRTLIRSRLGVGMAAYDTRFENADVVLFEPERDDYRMFFTNIFSFSERRAVCQHGYRRTRQQLLARRQSLEPLLARHGVRLRLDVLQDEERDDFLPSAAVPRRQAPAHPVIERLDSALSRLDALLDAEETVEEATSALAGVESSTLVH